MSACIMALMERRGEKSEGGLSRRVLIVDDEPLVLDSMRRMLATNGYHVETAQSAEAALELLGREKFDLIITDYAMPLKRGDQLAAAIKAMNPIQPVAMITAYAEAIQYAGIDMQNLDMVMEKPVGLQEFRQAVAKLLARRGFALDAPAKSDKISKDESVSRPPSPRFFDPGKQPERGRILVIDPDPEAAVMIFGILHAAGYLVDIASGVNEAAQIARMTAPDLVLAEISTPEQSSLELLSELQRLVPAVKVVGTCNTSEAAEGENASHLASLLRKPFTQEELLVTIQKALA